MGLQNTKTKEEELGGYESKVDSDPWFEKELETSTDWTYAEFHRDKYIGKYEYILAKEIRDMEPFEIAMRWYLRMKGYDDLTNGWNEEPGHNLRKKGIEEETDEMIKGLRIPLQYVEEMRKW